MANEFTSVATAGWGTNTVKATYDLAFRWAFNAQPYCWQLIDFQPEQPAFRGSSVQVQFNQYYGEAAVTAAKSALTEEADIDSTKLPATTTVTFTPEERGGANTRTLKLANRAMTAVDPVIARTLADWSAKTHDELLQDRMVACTQVYRAADRASTVTVAATDYLAAKQIRLAVTKLRVNQAETRDGSYYAGVVHPNVVYDLRVETGSGSWRVPNEYGTDQSRIWNGEVGAFEGVRFIENPRMRNATDGASSARVYRGFILGREALGKHVITGPETRIGPVTDKLSRFRTIGWYSDLDVQIARDLAIVRLESASAAV